MKTCTVWGPSLSALALAGGRLEAAENFQKLNGGQVRAKFAGMELTDGVHWRDVFERNGALAGYSMGRKTAWKVEHPERSTLPRSPQGLGKRLLRRLDIGHQRRAPA